MIARDAEETAPSSRGHLGGEAQRIREHTFLTRAALDRMSAARLSERVGNMCLCAHELEALTVLARR